MTSTNLNFITLKITNPQSGDFVVNHPDTDTLKDLIQSIRDGLNARGTKIDNFCGPCKVPLTTPLKDMKMETLTINVVNSQKYQKTKGVVPKEFVEKEPIKTEKKTTSKIETTTLKTATKVSCHKCRQKRDIVYLCPKNEKHRFCPRCVNGEALKIMEKDGCPVCQNTCQCCLCKKRPSSHVE
ncbi:hypothetical protein EIN_340630 [Entamoeba invadens IP1]|uniref:Uncharacterized protein n=1 Tax=Entamoeba invadens IP1 TaxID=370355 RepID=A0A0A1UDP2_ENTIV|nr:hypothetical protein EIN_340630 [Entamoeba invadens IP1]ELP94725.1 hypothetical protein EIN_340630 [Entamoeba invadens IP1]|eukprot:XP_004261496.1 hypothetical protein EIN_340630 [Entamoeba invadens IP1]